MHGDTILKAGLAHALLRKLLLLNRERECIHEAAITPRGLRTDEHPHTKRNADGEGKEDLPGVQRKTHGANTLARTAAARNTALTSIASPPHPLPNSSSLCPGFKRSFASTCWIFRRCAASSSPARPRLRIAAGSLRKGVELSRAFAGSKSVSVDDDADASANSLVGEGGALSAGDGGHDGASSTSPRTPPSCAPHSAHEYIISRERKD